MSGTATLHIDLKALAHNFNTVKKYLSGQKILAMVKANAYGHGLLAVADTLQAVDAFGVANLDEALCLRNAGFTHPILLNSGVDTLEDLKFCEKYQLNCVIHSPHQIELLKQAPSMLHTVWLKIDTGMHRLGFDPDQALLAYETLKNQKLVEKIIWMTHLACAEVPNHPMNNQQIEKFNAVTEQYPEEKSIARSAVIVSRPDLLADWVRPGVMLYGGSPLDNRLASEFNLKPVMTLTAPIIAIKKIKAGETVGYAASWQAPESQFIAIVALGYGDGYSRAASVGAPVYLQGEYSRVLGRVSMDMIAIDLKSLGDTVKIGDVVELWGAHLPIDQVAAAMNTISYELMTGVSARVRRTIIK